MVIKRTCFGVSQPWVQFLYSKRTNCANLVKLPKTSESHSPCGKIVVTLYRAIPKIREDGVTDFCGRQMALRDTRASSFLGNF